jgi:very-short-patch-repair endonuclease
MARRRTKGSLAEDFPAIAAEWHPSLNGESTPADFASGVKHKAWWLCPKGHSYDGAIGGRTRRGRGCPYCSGRRLLPENSLSLCYPEVAKEWHPTRNGALVPEKVSRASAKKVWWQCSNNAEHVWEASVSNRTNRGSKCPRCSHQTSSHEIRILSELLSLFREVLPRHRIESREVDVYLPSISVALEYDGSYWHKDKKEVDLAKTAFLESKGIQLLRVRESPLPPLSEHDVIVPVRSALIKVDMDSIAQALEPFCDEETKTRLRAYRCQDQFQNEAVYLEYLSYTPDPFPENSLHARFPDVAKEFDLERNFPLTPLNVSWGCKRVVWWKCTKSNLHSWSTAVCNRTNASNQTGCPFCSGRKVCADNNLAVLAPLLAKQWHDELNGSLKPEDIVPGARKLIWWVCEKDSTHVWRASPDNRTRRNSGCPYCVNRMIDNKNNLLVLNPALAREWHPTKNGELRPEDVARSANRSVWWKCPAGDDHEWEETINNRSNGRRCPFCFGKKATSAKNLEICFPGVARLWHPTKNQGSPADYLPGSNVRVWWKCPMGDDHEWQSQIIAMTGRNDLTKACPVCRSLAFRFPDIASEWHPVLNGKLTPASVASGSGFLAWWMCARDRTHIWQATVNHRTSHMQSCPSCRGGR